jgi:hypothetical protein
LYAGHCPVFKITKIETTFWRQYIFPFFDNRD